MFKLHSIGNRIILIAVTFMVLILMFVVVVAVVSSQRALRSQAIGHFTTRTEQVAAAVEQQLQEVQASVNAMAEAISDEAIVNDASRLRETLREVRLQHPYELIYRVSVLRPDGSVGVMNIANPRTDEYRWRVWGSDFRLDSDTRLIAPLDSGEPVWLLQDSAAYDDESRSVVTLSVPYSVSGDAPDGVIWVDIPLYVFQQVMNDILSIQGLSGSTLLGYALLLNEAEVPITTHNVPLMISDDEMSANIHSLMEATMTQRDADTQLWHVNSDPFNQRPVFFTALSIEPANWELYITLPQEEIPTVPSLIIAPAILASVVGVFVMVLVLKHLIDRLLVMPMRDLTQAAQEIGSGDLRFYIGYRNQSDEIGRLADALDDMRENIAHSYDAMANWSRSLEQRVVERTEQLDQARLEAQTTAGEMRAIYDESLLVVSEVHLSTVLDAFVMRMLSLLNASYCAVWLLTEDDAYLEMVAVTDELHREITIVIPSDSGITGQCVQTRQPIVLPDYNQYENRIVLDDRGITFSRTLAVPLMFQGQPIGAVVTGRKIDAPEFSDDDVRINTLFANLVSPAVRSAQLYVRTQEAVDAAERANQVKTRFLASVTHELRTPLNLIINNMDFMRIGAFGEINEEQEMRLNQTVRSAEHLLYLINDLLDVSKIDAGEMQLHIQESDIKPLLEDALDTAYATMDRLGDRRDSVEIIAEIEDELPSVPMDTRRIRQVVTNLLTNAVKFTTEGEVRLIARAEVDGIYIAVQDTGSGIPDEEMHVLFQPFGRTSQAKEDQIEGTGLGLPISHYLVRQHGAELQVESEVGKGTLFHFTLPYEEPLRPTDEDHRGSRMIELMWSSDDSV